MTREFAIGLCALGLAAGIEATAHAQVCSGSPGTVTVTATTTATTIKLTNGTIKANAVDCGSATAVVVNGTSGNDTITFNYVPPTIPISTALGAGKNVVVLYGTTGNDVIVGKATGADRDGNGSQDLTFDVLPATFAIHGKAGDDVMDFTNSGMKLSIYAEQGNDNITGSAFNDMIDLSTGDDFADGGAGNDVITAGPGNDAVVGGSGNDTFNTAKTFDGYDQFTGGSGTDTVAYSSRTVGVVIGTTAAEDFIDDDVETIKGGKASDSIDFGSGTGPHNLYGGPGNDFVRGGAGNDKVFGEDGNDQVYGGGGNDKVYGGNGTDLINGGPGTDTLYGDAGDDSLESNDGVAEIVNGGTETDEYINDPLDTFKTCEVAANEVPLTNGSFETGDYSGWTVVDAAVPGGDDIWGNGAEGDWINNGNVIHDFEAGADFSVVCAPGHGLPIQASNGGRTAFELQYYVSEHRMYQDVVVPSTATTLSFDLGFYMSGPFAAGSQELHLYLRDPSTDAIVTTLYTSADPYVPAIDGDMGVVPVQTYYADVSAYRGQNIRIDFDANIQSWCTPLVIDNFRVHTTVGAPFAPDDLVPPAGTQLATVTPAATATPRALPTPAFTVPAEQVQEIGTDGSDDGTDPTDDGSVDPTDSTDELGDDGDDGQGGCSTSRGSSGGLATGVLIGLALMVRRRRRA